MTRFLTYACSFLVNAGNNNRAIIKAGVGIFQVLLASCTPVIVSEIEHGLDFFSDAVRNLPNRHRSLRAVFDTSWQMMTGPERRVMQQLSVFRGDFTRQAALGGRTSGNGRDQSNGRYSYARLVGLA
jgi:hypothetical protein